MELRINDLEEAGLTHMHIFKLLQIAAGITETNNHNKPLEANVSTNLPKETIQKALKQVGAGKDAE